ncbi:MAG: thiol-disulfide oxidoreductase DCC family protein [Polyangiales bacterium]
MLYDGACALCNRLCRFILERDPSGTFHFASIQGAFGRSTLTLFGKNPDDLDTFYVLANADTASPKSLLAKAAAALFVARRLGGVFRIFVILRLLPMSFLDAAYDLVARNRYRLFGRQDDCLVPNPNHKDRFLDP